MDMSTGEIMTQEEMEKRIKQNPKLADRIKLIPEALQPQIPEIQNMNRKDKRAWLRKNKHLFK